MTVSVLVVVEAPRVEFPDTFIPTKVPTEVREEVRTIVPSECIAEIDVRLVLESDPIRLHNLIKSHIEALGYYVIDRRRTNDERLKHL